MDVVDRGLDLLATSRARGVIAGLLVAVFLLGGLYVGIRKSDNVRKERIAWLKREIERQRPPANTSQIDWQKIMLGLKQKQDVFWGRRVLMLARRVPEKMCLEHVELVPASEPVNGKNKNKGKTLPGLVIRGGLYAPDPDITISELGQYILDVLGDQAFMDGFSPVRLTRLERTGGTRVEFGLRIPR